MARLMDGEIVQSYLHATGGTGFYFVLPLEGEKHEGIGSPHGYGTHTMYTEFGWYDASDARYKKLCRSP